MVEEKKLSGTIREQVVRFGEMIACGLKKPQKKFVFQMLFGLLAAKDVKLSSIARSLQQKIPLIKTENRLSRQTKKSDLTNHIIHSLIGNGASRIKDDTVLAIDISDITKEYTFKMEHLASVRDGSTGEIKKGYWLLGILAADVRGERLTPLFTTLYSQNADDFESENTQIMGAIDSVREATKEKGIWAMDRGGDRKCLIYGLLQRLCRFAIRLNGDRNLIDRYGNTRRAVAIANGLRCRENIEVMVEEPEGKVKHRVWVGSTNVKLPGRKESLTLVVVKGFGNKPMMLLTNVEDKTAQEIIEIYLTRWKCDESYRFLKTSYNLEDVRVRSYVGLRNIVVFLLAVFYFLAVILGERFQVSILVKKILEKAKRFFQIPEFKFYALADGIYWILIKGGPGPPLREKVENIPQLAFSFLK